MTQSIQDRDNLHTIIVGSGPVGVRFATELLTRQPNARVSLYGDESVRPYNRVQLSSLLAGNVSVDDIALSMPTDSDRFTFIPQQIVGINTDLKHVESADGTTQHFDYLVLATGARAHVPNIEGLDQRGVYTFRSLKDAEYLYARTLRAQHIVIVGGGLLGIETARALLKNNTQVTLVQQGSRLMNKQLDDSAASLLQSNLESLGIRVIVNAGVREISGGGRVSGVILRTREEIACDTVLFCSGITPNIALAREARLRVNRGIVVDDDLRTSHEAVFAIGECCEHQGETYGIVNPGFEQAAVLADIFGSLTNPKEGQASYNGSLLSTKLKVIDTPITSFGTVVSYQKTPFHRELVFRQGDVYRKLVTYQRTLVGGVSVGDWGESNRVLETFKQGRKLSWWQAMSFRLGGKLWPFSESGNVATWPAESIVCQCRNIGKSTLCAAIDAGAHDVPALSKLTSASSVCGSCKPLLQELISSRTGVKTEREKEWAWSPILLISLVAFVLALCVLMVPGIKVGESVNAPAMFEHLWNDKFWKQVTGFTLLGLSVVGALMSVRKRINSERLGKFAYWRLMHILLGMGCAVTLMLHSGLHLGDNLNRWLMLNFLAVLILGSLAGSVVALSHRLQPVPARRTVKFWSWLHILVTWPLPILLGMHILTVYYF